MVSLLSCSLSDLPTQNHLFVSSYTLRLKVCSVSVTTMLSLSYLLKYASFLGLTNAACNYGTLEFPREAQVPASKFSYDGLTGPLNWYGLNTTANAMCDHGTNQSPITINALGTGASNGTSKTEGTAVSFSVPPYPAGAVFENLGTNVEVVVNGSLVDAGKNFSLAQFHFHTPSEHRINDEYFPMEMHFVFQAAGSLLPISKSTQSPPPLTQNRRFNRSRSLRNRVRPNRPPPRLYFRSSQRDRQARKHHPNRPPRLHAPAVSLGAQRCLSLHRLAHHPAMQRECRVDYQR